MRHRISDDESRLGQVFWFMLFLGWVPQLASYTHVLDPTQASADGLLVTITTTISLYEQTYLYHPALGILTFATVIALGTLAHLRWWELWPIPVFLALSTQIHLFNEAGPGGPLAIALHIAYAVFATWSAILFLRFGHLLSFGFGLYVCLLLLDWGLFAVTAREDTAGMSLIGFVYSGYAPSLTNTLLFIALAVILRMLWLMVRDNRRFVAELPKGVFWPAFRKAALLWSPMFLIFAVCGLGWSYAINGWLKPKVLAEVMQEIEIVEDKITEAILANPIDFLTRRIAGAVYETEAKTTAWIGQSFPEEYKEVFSEEAIRYIASRADAEEPFDYTSASDVAIYFYKRAGAPRDSIAAGAIADWTSTVPNYGDALQRAYMRLSVLQIGLTGERTAASIIALDLKGREVKNFPNALRDQMETDFPEDALPLLDLPSCFFLDPVCNTERGLKKAGNTMMKDARQSVIDETHNALSDPLRQTGQSVRDQANSARALNYLNTANAQITAASSLAEGFQLWRNFTLLMAAYSVIILLKSLIVVFSRVIFAPKGQAAQFLPDTPAQCHGLSRHGQSLTIPRDADEAFFISRWGVTLEGPPPARRRPLGFRFPIARILALRWSMNRIEAERHLEEDEFDAELKVDEPAELVTWKLEPGERVVFRFPDMVGMSDSVHIRRITSLSLTTLVLGRMIYYAAEGPGTLILRTTAAARVAPESAAERPAPSPKLVAWSSGTRFAIHAALTRIDTFMSGYNLRVNAGDGVVWDSSTKRGDGPGRGILRFATSFLLPI